MKEELVTYMPYSFLDEEFNKEELAIMNVYGMTQLGFSLDESLKEYGLSKERYCALFNVVILNEPPKELVDFVKAGCRLPIKELKYVGKYFNGRNAYRVIYDIKGCPKLGMPVYYTTDKEMNPQIISGHDGLDFFIYLKRLNKAKPKGTGGQCTDFHNIV